MSLRRSNVDNATAQALKEELAQLKKDVKAAQLLEIGGAASAPDVCIGTSEFDKLTPVERDAASLGVHPDAWSPLKFMNDGHYVALQKAHALAPDLARQIKAFQTVSAAN